jgi:hypothetical protein
MRASEFNALIKWVKKNTKISSTAMIYAAKDVMVKGAKKAQAARDHDLTPQSVNYMVKRLTVLRERMRLETLQ